MLSFYKNYKKIFEAQIIYDLQLYMKYLADELCMGESIYKRVD